MAQSNYGLDYEAYVSKHSRPRKSEIRQIRRALRKLNSGSSHWRHSDS